MSGLWEDLRHLILPFSLITVFFAAGIMVNRIVFGKLQHIVAKAPNSFQALLIKSVQGIPVCWGTVVGIYAAINTVPMNSSLQSFMEKALLVLWLFSLTMVFARISVGVVSTNAQKATGVLPSTSILANIAELIAYSVGLLIIFQSIGVSITPILTALGVGGIAIALALQDTLSNLFSGLHLILSKKLKPGDYIRLSSGEEGYITDINWRDTTLRALYNHMVVVVPNAKIASAIITNYALPVRDVLVVVPVGVSYDSDLEHVEQVSFQIAKHVAQKVKGGVSDFKPIVRFTGFGDSNINLEVIVRVHEYNDQFQVKSELIKQIHLGFRQAGIVIAYPTQTLHLPEAFS